MCDIADTCARNDLILASMSGSKPYFPWLWPVDPFVLVESNELSTFGSTSQTPQSGFTELSCYLPVQAVYCFKSLACIGRLPKKQTSQSMD